MLRNYHRCHNIKYLRENSSTHSKSAAKSARAAHPAAASRNGPIRVPVSTSEQIHKGTQATSKQASPALPKALISLTPSHEIKQSKTTAEQPAFPPSKCTAALLMSTHDAVPCHRASP